MVHLLQSVLVAIVLYSTIGGGKGGRGGGRGPPTFSGFYILSPPPPLSYKTDGLAPHSEFTSSAYEHIHFCPQFFQGITIVINIYLEGGSAEPPWLCGPVK